MSEYEYVKIEVPREYAPLAKLFAECFARVQRSGAPHEVGAFIALGMVFARGQTLGDLADKPFGEVAKIAHHIGNEILHAEGVEIPADGDTEPDDAARAEAMLATMPPKGTC
jgi:hypothetical protein